jgi:hypothetical protein
VKSMPDVSETFKRLESDPQEGSQYILSLLERVLEPLVLKLDRVLERRLVRPMLQCLVAILRLRNTPQAQGTRKPGSVPVGWQCSRKSRK